MTANISFAESNNSINLTTRRDPAGLESLRDYKPGGFHPVEIEDALDDRYIVLLKLGHGRYSTVWLCMDTYEIKRTGTYETTTTDTYETTTKHVAIKIMKAAASIGARTESRIKRYLKRSNDDTVDKYLLLSTDKFEIHGPNGTHSAFVYPLLGPRVMILRRIAYSEDPGPVLRKLCFDATKALATMHAHGICHGDFRPSNILTRIPGLDCVTEPTLYNLFGEAETNKIVHYKTEQPHDLETVPEYLVYPLNWDRGFVRWNQEEAPELSVESACLIDFGQSYPANETPRQSGTLMSYRSPEDILEQRLGKEADLWALGCTLFEIRTGRALFNGNVSSMESILWNIPMLLGKYPDPWWYETWRSRGNIFENEPDNKGRVVVVSSAKDFVPTELIPRSLKEAIARGFSFKTSNNTATVKRSIREKEVEIFADLLSKLLTYNPEDRISAHQALGHEWFNL